MVKTLRHLGADVITVVLGFCKTNDVAHYAVSEDTKKDARSELKRRTVRFKVEQLLAYTLICSANHFGPVRIVRRTKNSVWYEDSRTRCRSGPHRRQLRFCKHLVRMGGGYVDGLAETFKVDGGCGSVYPDCEWDDSQPDGGFPYYMM